MSKAAAYQIREKEADSYATQEEFHRIFDEGRDELYQLSFLLTRDHETAQRCLVGGLEDCVGSNRVFREWARSWAKRTIIQNAIRELKPRSTYYHSSLPGVFGCDIDETPNCPGGHFAMDSLLTLGNFERFVFVMSVLEHYSEHDCALLLGSSVRETREARARAVSELMMCQVSLQPE